MGKSQGCPEYGYTRDRLLAVLHTNRYGLSEKEAARRLRVYGYNQPAVMTRITVLGHLVKQFINPLVIILFVIALLSWFLGQRISAIFVGTMIFMSVLLSFVQEYRSNKAAEKLRELVKTTATVYRDGQKKEVDIRSLVPGDVVVLNAGDIIPADLRLLHTKELFVNESSLTGESLPVEKFAQAQHHRKASESDIVALMGSSVVSGSGMGVIVKTGIETQFGKISHELASASTESSFEKGIKSFTWMMIRVIVVLAGVIFLLNLFTKNDIVQSILFALAVAVGLAPEMLPMLVTVNLSKGAIMMARKKVIVKKLNSIQNFGAMDVLCTDKTGTLTENRIILEKYCDIDGHDDDRVLRLAYINSSHQTGVQNLLDKAILAHKEVGRLPYAKVDEIPFDFQRRIMSVVIEHDSEHRLVAKGAPEEIFKRCTHYELHGKRHAIHGKILAQLRKEFDVLSADGLMVLAVAYRDFETPKHAYGKDDEKGITLRGYVAFLDPPKASATKTLKSLSDLGIETKVITGDNELVTQKICKEVGLVSKGTVIGEQIAKLNDAQLRRIVEKTTIFARLNPLQKERVIVALRQNGHTVGYLGDGINDAPALKVSDVGISVNNAVDIAKESADIILLEKDLSVLKEGVLEGRKVFGNITKYIRMGASSNFGNMFSMTGGSLLPFLPMAPVQILLNNFLYDFSQLALPTDDVDKDYLRKPRPWDVAAIRRFMFFLGPLSSVFDFITFGVLWFIFHAQAPLFQTGWFLESLCTQTLIVHVIRTNKIPFIESMPSRFLLIMTILTVGIGIYLPYSPLAIYLGLVRPPPAYFIALAVIVSSYLYMVWKVKGWLIKKYQLE
jgi:Mg2+-importing ATPase